MRKYEIISSWQKIRKIRLVYKLLYIVCLVGLYALIVYAIQEFR